MEYVDWIVRGIVGVIVVSFALWAVKGWLTEKTRLHKVTDQPITFGELIKHCKTQHLNVERSLMGEIGHLKELIEKDLEHGRVRFAEIMRKQEAHDVLLSDINKHLKLWMEENGKKNEEADR